MAGPVYPTEEIYEVTNPKVPYFQEISMGSNNGNRIIITGTPHFGCDRFNIKLKTSSDDHARISPMFDQGYVVRYSSLVGEEKFGALPIKRGEKFKCTIQFKFDLLLISFDDIVFCEYCHRLPVGHIRYLGIDGGVQLDKICFDPAKKSAQLPQPEKVLNPAVPYAGEIEYATNNENSIVIKGIPLLGSNSFQIKLESSSGGYASISPKFDQRCIVRQSSSGGEEKSGALPIKRGEKFKCTIQFKFDVLVIWFDDTIFCEYIHRLQGANIRCLKVDGGVKLQEVCFEPGKSVQLPQRKQVLRPEVPFSQEIADASTDGNRIIIIGTPFSDSFEINLKASSADIVQIKPRFDKGCIVRNTFLNGAWGAEEKLGVIPLERGKRFECTIQFGFDSLEIWFNHKPFCEYRHRLPRGNIRYLNITGDLQLNCIYWEPTQGNTTNEPSDKHARKSSST